MSIIRRVRFLEVTDRYKAAGRSYPDPKTVCRGRCEGMGFYPTKNPKEWPEGAKPDEIGFVFVKCAPCNGTGRRDGKGATADIEGSVRKIRKAIGG